METTFIEVFGRLEDKRIDRTKKHLLLDIIGLSLCALIAGAQNFEEISDYGQSNIAWLKTYFTFENGIPSHDTIGRVFGWLDSQAFQECFLEWLNKVSPFLPEGVIAIDGKTLRGSRRKNKKLKALHIVSAWSCVNGISLGQLKVDGKSNEITAIPELLTKLVLKGAIVTRDAMGTQKDFAHQIQTQGADYVFAVKGNQGTLHKALINTFAQAEALKFAGMTYFTAEDEWNGSHGRVENRYCTVLPLMYLHKFKAPWKGIQSLVRIVYRNSLKNSFNKKVNEEVRYFISSLDPKDPKKILQSIRQHWQIEGVLHWSLDVTMREDASRLRNETAAENMAWLRKMAFALLKKESSVKKSIRRKQLRACMEPSYLLTILQQAQHEFESMEPSIMAQD